MTPKAVLLDTSFLIRFLKEDDPLFTNADQYFRYFLLNNVAMMISTISIAEYCVKGSIEELPFRNAKVLPFTIKHAESAGTFARLVFDARSRSQLADYRRVVIPNDTKLFAQAHTEALVRYYISSDLGNRMVLETLQDSQNLGFEFIDLNTPCHEYFQTLNL